MNTLLETIEPQSDTTYRIVVAIDSEQFTFMLKIETVNGLRVVSGDPEFSRQFANHADISLEIEKLVAQFHLNKPLTFPIQVGTFEIDSSIDSQKVSPAVHL